MRNELTEVFILERGPTAEQAERPDFAVRLRPDHAVRLVSDGAAGFARSLATMLSQNAGMLASSRVALARAAAGALRAHPIELSLETVDGGCVLRLAPYTDFDGRTAGVVATVRAGAVIADTASSKNESGLGDASDVHADVADTPAGGQPPRAASSGQDTPGPRTDDDPRTRFLAVLSHELRSPLASVQGWAHVLERALSGECGVAGSEGSLTYRALHGIRDGLASQVRQIDALVDATRVLAGDFALTRTQFPVEMPINIAIARSRPQWKTRGQRVQVDAIAPQLAVEIEADLQRLVSVLSSLLSNASKFSDDGAEIRIGVAVGDGVLELSVQDRGRGFPPEAAQRLFEPFAYLDNIYTRHVDGFGVSLAVAHRLIAAHGGSLHAHSAGPGEGARMMVTLPCDAPASQYTRSGRGAAAASEAEGGLAAPPEAPAARRREDALPSLAGVSVLVVDDQSDVREAICAVLEERGAEVLTAASGAGALAILAARGAAREPDVLICDIAMPGCDGYATLSRIRSWENASDIAESRRPPAIAVTALTGQAERDRAFEHGYCLHFEKPVDPPRLLGAVAALAER